MTRHGKCETCRRRKVKCDERHPTCGPCSVKRRPCHYVESVFVHDSSLLSLEPSTATSPGFDHDHDDNKNGHRVTLRLKRHQKALAGEGEFLTFEAIQPPSPCAGPLSPQTKVTANLSSIFGCAALDLAPLGPWVRFGWPTTAGTNKTIELASEYAFEATVAFQHLHSEQSLARANRIGVAALRSLQTSIRSERRKEDREALMVAVMLHFAAENFAGIATWRYIPHLQGVCHLLNAYFQDEPDNPLAQKAVDLICDHEVANALHFGRPSSLETLANPAHPLTEPPSVENAAVYVNDLLIRIPRLVCAVRACVQDPENLTKMAEATALAKALYRSENAFWVQTTISASSTSIPSDSSNHSIPPAGAATLFDSVPAYILATRFHLSRLLLHGLLQTLTSLTLSHLFLPPSLSTEAAEGERAAACSIAECLDFALRPNPAQTLIAVQMVMPLEACLGTWGRVERRTRDTLQVREWKQSVEMKEWCVGHLRELCARWRAGPIPRRNWEALYDVFVGGPLMGRASDHQKRVLS